MRYPGLFLDRDGVINHDPGDYTCNLSEFHLLPKVTDALKLAHNQGFKIIVITNQAGIALGRYSETDLAEINAFLHQTAIQHQFEFTDILWSPYHSKLSESLTRKPGSLLIEKAIYKHHIDPKKSIMIGDK